MASCLNVVLLVAEYICFINQLIDELSIPCFPEYQGE